MPLIPQLNTPGGRKRALSNAHPGDLSADLMNAYVQMQYLNSPRFVPLPMSPGPGYMAAPGYSPFPMAWPSPHFYPVDMQAAALPVPDPRSTAVHMLLGPPSGPQSHILYDVRYKPDKCYLTTTGAPIKLPEEFAELPATRPTIAKMRLVCRDLPWRISVTNSKGVTIKNILESIHSELHQPLTEGEWWIAQDEERERTLEAYKKNCAEELGEKRKLEEGVKRIDWLGNRTMLMAISRGPLDEPFIKSRVMDPKAQAETWIMDMGISVEKPVILKVFTRKYQLSLKPEAIAYLEEILEEHEIDDDQVQGAMEYVAKEYMKQDGMHSSFGLFKINKVILLTDCTTIVTRENLEKIYALMQLGGSNPNSTQNTLLDPDELDPEQHLYFINAMEMPRWLYSYERKAFEKAPNAPSLGGTPASRAQFLRDRHNIIKQVVLRNENFSPPAIAGRDRDNYLKLTSTKNLLGRTGQRFLLFGMLTHAPDGRLCLEDLEGRVVLDISETGPSEGLFTEGCFVLVEGDYTEEEVLQVIAIGHPPSERRDAARSVYGHIDFLGKGATTVAEDEQFAEGMNRFSDLVFMCASDLWLDSPKTLGGLRKILDGYVASDFIPLVFIFCGNFTSKDVGQGSGIDLIRYQDNLDALGDLLASYPRIANHSHFVFVPGPLDPWGSATLPRPPIPASFCSQFQNKLPKAHFASNPCRIKFCGQEIVIFRHDLMAKMLRNLVGVKPDVESADLKRYLVQTILDQCHLSPLTLSVQPTIWELDHALRLYPMPTTLILADKYERYELTYEGCHVFNPGMFQGTLFGFSTYYPETRRSEPSFLEDDEN
ncbi:DNA-directed DNA polymerase epsilon, subunit B [Tulasnella sp. 403]|nr:DNA-directed DNA polymerase epsilon, subunit B [Tulasnella sp. 403]